MNKDKVLLTYKTEDGNFQVESVWATKNDTYYQIDNIPFFAENIAYGDLVSVEEDNGAMYFEDLIQASGHSTIQVIFFGESYVKEFQEAMEQFKCPWEGSHVPTLISVDIPKDVLYQPVKEYLQKGEDAGYWSYKEACLSHEA
jgi:hypothetical protein